MKRALSLACHALRSGVAPQENALAACATRAYSTKPVTAACFPGDGIGMSMGVGAYDVYDQLVFA